MPRPIADPDKEQVDALKIGQLAARAAVSVDAIRFYERRGILPLPERRPSGYRVYRRADVDRIRATKALQKLGFTLDEVIDALDAFNRRAASCDNERWRLEAVLARVDAKIHELQRLRGVIVQTVERCRAGTCAVSLTNGDVGGDSSVAPFRRTGQRLGSRTGKRTKHR